MGAPINDGPRQNLGATFVTFSEPLLYQKNFDVIFSNQID